MIDLILGLYFIICLKFLVEFYKLATFMLLYLFYCCFLYIHIISLVSACGVLVMRQRRLCEEELHIYLWLCLLYFLGHFCALHELAPKSHKVLQLDGTMVMSMPLQL